MDRPDRPDPDALLARLGRDEGQPRRGRLRIFFGAAAGVGKTYAMLQAARERRAQGLPVLVGLVETHGRAETEALLEGLDILPRRLVTYRDITLGEFDRQQALDLRPSLILVDELAHTNAPGSHHPKRWQDVQDLVEAGCEVWTTLNVQHLESLNGVVAQITGIVVQETVPDSILEMADDVEIIDLPVDELLGRMREGKVYAPDLAGRALEKFFRKGNLIALRELALRATAERVDAQMQVWRRGEAEAGVWAVTERIVVAISASPSAAALVRAARRMAGRSRAPWITVWVDTPRQRELSAKEREYASQALRLAESLGGEAVTLEGQDAVEDVVHFARRRNATRIITGKPGKFWWRDRLLGSFVDELVRKSGDIDVTVVTVQSAPWPAPQPLRRSWRWQGYAGALGVEILATATAAAMFRHFELSNLIMVFLLATVVVAGRWGRGPGALSALLGVGVFDFFFVPPYWTLAVSDTQYLVTFTIMLVVGLVIGTLTARIREQVQAARRREQETGALYALGRDLGSTRGVEEICDQAARHIGEAFGVPVCVLVPAAGETLRPVGHQAAAFHSGEEERAVADWVFRHRAPAGWGTDTLQGAAALYLPLAAAEQVLGVLALNRQPEAGGIPPGKRPLLEAFSNQLALALQREHHAREAEQHKLRVEAEQLQSALLGAVSHDLRTPLASITGSASALLHSGREMEPGTRRDLTQAIFDEAGRLGRLVSNLLDMGRLGSGTLQLRLEPQPLDEIAGAAIQEMGGRLENHPLEIDFPDTLPLINADGVLVQRVFVNLLENAVRYTPAGTPLLVAARAEAGLARVQVADRGPGLEPGEEERIFEKFRRGGAARDGRGSGLGLAICRGIVEAHGGGIVARRREGGGAEFEFTLPLVGESLLEDSSSPKGEERDGI